MSGSLYEEIGGLDTVNASVDLMYESMLSDESIKSLFDGVNLSRHRLHQKQFITYACGGPNNLDSQPLVETDSFLWDELTDQTHKAAVKGHLGEALEMLGTDEQQVEQVFDAIENAIPDLSDYKVTA